MEQPLYYLALVNGKWTVLIQHFIQSYEPSKQFIYVIHPFTPIHTEQCTLLYELTFIHTHTVGHAIGSSILPKDTSTHNLLVERQEHSLAAIVSSVIGNPNSHDDEPALSVVIMNEETSAT